MVTPEARTFAEGLATREPVPLTLSLLPKLVDEMTLVSDDATPDVRTAASELAK